MNEHEEIYGPWMSAFQNTLLYMVGRYCISVSDFIDTKVREQNQRERTCNIVVCQYYCKTQMEEV